MISIMEPKGELCDNNLQAILSSSAISQRGVDLHIIPDEMTIDCEQLSKKVLKLDLNQQRSEKKTITYDEEGNEKTSSPSILSPKSPLSDLDRSSGGGGGGGRNNTISHQTSITSQIEVVEDRKALRDALYQGIFHRHRRTIFAVGSFLRMLRTRNSQYNTIRSLSEGEDDTR